VKIFFTGFVVVQNGVAMTEGAAFAVLTAQAHVIIFGGETGEGERFGGGPIEREFAGGHLGARLEELLELGMR